jgi:alpha-beta hydrolase superfamily lysophospholipase
MVMTIVMRRAAFALIFAVAFSIGAPAQESASIVSHDIQFVSHGAILKGTVFIPGKSPIVAAVVLVRGAGRAERMRSFSSSLARFGLAVLTYDKRGVGESGGIYAGPEVGTNNVTPEDLHLLADDAGAAMRRLHLEKNLRSAPCGFIGFSQAGWIVPLAALKNRRARFMVLWSGAAETTHEDFLFEQLALSRPDFWDQHTHEEVRAMMVATVDKI